MALGGEAGKVFGDLERDGLGGDAPWPVLVAITNRARPPISADKTTLASATTAAGGEIVENLLLARALCVERLTRSPRAHSRTQRKRLSPVVL